MWWPVDTEWVSAASDAVVSRETHTNSECVPTVVPKLAEAPQAASEVVQPRPPDSSCTEWFGMEVTGGSPPADSDSIVNPDVLLTAIYVTTEVSEKWDGD